MTSSSDNLPEGLNAHLGAIRLLTEVFQETAIRFFLIGAQARDVHFFSKGIRLPRQTRDVDYAVMVDSLNEFERLISLLQSRGFETTSLPYRLVWNGGKTMIDLLPFGGIEQEHHVRFVRHDMEISVLGYRELLNDIQLLAPVKANLITVPVPPLHGIFILKLISWDDKKPDRRKDLLDMSQILRYYWEFVEEEAYEQHLDLFHDQFDTSECAARILGRHLSVTLSRSDRLKERVMKILIDESRVWDRSGSLLHTFSLESGRPVAEVQNLIQQVLNGITESA